MTSKNQPSDWHKDFQDFQSVGAVSPPSHVSREIFLKVHDDLNPSPWIVFSKVALLHALMGSVTLLFCPQFGISLFGGMGLMGIFMRYGEQGCMLGCGAVFLGGSALAASLLLKTEEVRVLRKTEILQIAVLGLLSLGVFICMGVGVVFEMLLFWLLGSILGGILTFEIGWRIRMRN
jgi:hypothetical protein